MRGRRRRHRRRGRDRSRDRSGSRTSSSRSSSSSTSSSSGRRRPARRRGRYQAELAAADPDSLVPMPPPAGAEQLRRFNQGAPVRRRAQQKTDGAALVADAISYFADAPAPRPAPAAQPRRFVPPPPSRTHDGGRFARSRGGLNREPSSDGSSSSSSELSRAERRRRRKQRLKEAAAPSAAAADAAPSAAPADPAAKAGSLWLGGLAAHVPTRRVVETFAAHGHVAAVSRSDGSAKVIFVRAEDAEAAKAAVLPATVPCAHIAESWDPPPPTPATPLRAKLDAGLWISQLEQIPSAARIAVRTAELSADVMRAADMVARAMLEHGTAVERAVAARRLPLFSFLDAQRSSPERDYYLWRVYSLCQGDTMEAWRTAPFQMFLGGPVWVPPPCPDRRNQPPEPPPPPLPSPPPPPPPQSGGTAERPLHDSERAELFGILRGLTSGRAAIRDAMVWCVDRAVAAADIAEVLTDALSLPQTPWANKMSRLMLVSDILYNCGSNAPGAPRFRPAFQRALPMIFVCLRQSVSKEAGSDANAAEKLTAPILRVLHTWRSWDLYPEEYLAALQSSVLTR